MLAPPQRIAAPSSTSSSSRSTAHPDLVVVRRTRAIYRSSSSGKPRARRQSSRDRHRQRRSMSTPKRKPAAPPPPKRHQPEPYWSLHYIHAVRRASPTVPPPEQPTEVYMLWDELPPPSRCQSSRQRSRNPRLTGRRGGSMGDSQKLPLITGAERGGRGQPTLPVTILVSRGGETTRWWLVHY
jgi:hypothetical protein